MATKIYKFQGTCEWAKVFEDNRDMKAWDDATQSFSAPSPCDGVYSLQLTMSDADYKQLKMSGSVAAKNSKFDEEGRDIVRFRREHVKKGKGGKVLDFASGAPKVTKADGSPWSFEDDGPIGNGSVVEVEVAVYDTAYNPGTRLEAVKVIDLVGIPERDSEEEWD